MNAPSNSSFDGQPGRVKTRWSRRATLRGIGAAGIMLALPILQACTAAPATPTEAPPTAPPRPTDVLPSPTPQPAAQPTATTSAAGAVAPTAAPTVAPTTAPTVTPAAASSTAAQLPAQNLVFTMWDTKPEVDIVQGVLDDFMKKQPNVKVTIQQIVNAERPTKYKLMATSGTPPDVSIGCCGEVATYGELGLLLNLDPLVSRDNFDKGAIFAGSLSEGVFDSKTKYIGQGNLLALPFNFVFHLCFYNKDMFKKANVDEPSYNWTWDDMVGIAQKLTLDKNGKKPTDASFDRNNVVQWGLGGAQWSEWDYILGAGGDYVTPENKVVINSPENLKAISFVSDLINKYKVLPVPSTLKNIAIFPSGTAVAITQDGSWNYRYWKGEIKSLFQWEVVPIPIGPIGKRIGYGGSNQFWSWKGVKNQDGSWEVMKHMIDPNMQLQWSAQWGIPSVKTAALNPDFPKVADFSPQMAKMAAEAGSYIKSSDPTIRVTEWQPIVAAELGPVWEGKVTPADALKSAQTKVEAIMSRPS